MLALCAFLGAGSWLMSRHDAHSENGPLNRMLVNHIGAAGRPVAPHIVGLSLETGLLATNYARTGPCAHNRLINTITLLGPAPLRIGGNSQDRTWVAQQPGRWARGAYRVGPSYWAALRCAASQERGRLTVGLNLAAGHVADTRAMVATARRLLPASRLRFALGNEPDRYSRRIPLHGPQLGGWGYRRYLREYVRVRDELSLKPSQTGGPDYSSGRWAPFVPAFARDARPGALQVHLYPLLRCRRQPGDRDWPTLERLASARSSRRVIGRLAPAIAAARARHIPMVISEANSVACSGIHGISDTTTSAAWAMDLIIGAAAAGIRAVHFHESNAPYDPFIVTRNGSVQLRPLWFGLLWAQRLLVPGTRIRTLSSNGSDVVAVWPVQHPDGRLLVVMINRSLHRPARVNFPAMGRFGLRIGRLQADGIEGQRLQARLGGGWSWVGRRVRQYVPAVNDRIRVNLAPGAVAVADFGQ